MPAVTASFTRPADTVPYAAGDLICNAGTPVALEFTPITVTTPLSNGSSRTWERISSSCRPASLAVNGAAPLRSVPCSSRGGRFAPMQLLTPPWSEWPAFTPAPTMRRSRLFRSWRPWTFHESSRAARHPADVFDSAVQNQLPFTPIRVLLQAMEPFAPLSGETFARNSRQD